MPSTDSGSVTGLSAGLRWTLRPPAADERLVDNVAADDAPVPTLAEIVRQRQLAGQPVLLLELGAGAGGVVWPVTIERRTLRGVPLQLIVGAGDNFFDYLPLPLPSGFDFSGLRLALKAVATASGVDGVLLPHRVSPWPDGSERWRREYENRCFEVGLEAKGWDVLTRKESLKRHRNRARKTLDYRVEHLHGPLPEETGTIVAALHRERWAFDGVPSLFADPRRAASYAACAERLLTTILYDGDTVLAAHVGMRFGSTVIWHTPVINLRYLAYSPLEILLLETVEECARQGVTVLDYGLGDESYKARFSNASRPVADTFVPTSMRGWLAHLLLHTPWLAGWRKRWPALRQRFIGRRVQQAGVLLHAPDKPVPEAMPAPGVERVVDFARLVDLFRIAGWELQRAHHELLRQGAVFCYQEIDGMRSGLWLSTAQSAGVAGLPAVASGVTLLHRLVGADAALLSLLAAMVSATPDMLHLSADRPELARALKARGWRG